MSVKHLMATPRVVRANTRTTVGLPLDTLSVAPPFKNMRVAVLPRGRISGDEAAPADITLRGNTLSITSTFPDEQEHVIFLFNTTGGQDQLVGTAQVYSLREDLFRCRPCKGDLHIHSNRSDGKESPPVVAAACRGVGLDFMMLTDHGLYEPSLEAIAAFGELDLDFAMFPGEEVHPPDADIHIVNAGGSFSVNRFFREEAPAYQAELEEIHASLSTPDLNDRDRRRYAAAVWCYRKISEAGGLSVFCHPYWLAGRRDNVSEPLVSQHLTDLPFDAFEIIGGYGLDEIESNIRQVARYHDERARGRAIPIVGVSDAHACHTHVLGWYYTIVFAESCDFTDIADAIRSLRSVAVEQIPGTTPRAHGPYRLVNYAQFLFREVFPEHDALCGQEGDLMLAHAEGSPAAASSLADLKGQVPAHWARCKSFRA